MIDYISSWAGQIITSVIIVTILEMILPNGNSKKYIKTIIGVYILYVMISPVLRLVNKGDLKVDYSKYEKYFGKDNIMVSSNTYTVEDRYNIELERQLKSDIQGMGYNVKKVSAELDLDKGVVEYVKVTVDKDKPKESGISVSINKVEVRKRKRRK
ncbi:MAG: stage III sporulation protein AF [Clostridia bacterium]|nr:stage III sporulation protein AF [Clostridia bacterium]MCI9275220.1 stage III sporulation protein AF [Clostridia bacterium]